MSVRFYAEAAEQNSKQEFIAAFFIGVFAVNGLPHFLRGISGEPFQSPFASPPGAGESAPWVNVLWGTANFVAVALLLNLAVIPCETSILLTMAAGGLAMALTLAWHFGRVRSN